MIFDKWRRKRRIKKLINKLNDFDPGSDYDEDSIPYWEKWHNGGNDALQG